MFKKAIFLKQNLFKIGNVQKNQKKSYSSLNGQQWFIMFLYPLEWCTVTQSTLVWQLNFFGLCKFAQKTEKNCKQKLFFLHIWASPVLEVLLDPVYPTTVWCNQMGIVFAEVSSWTALPWYKSDEDSILKTTFRTKNMKNESFGIFIMEI